MLNNKETKRKKVLLFLIIKKRKERFLKMKKYKKPLLIINEGFAEGVYAASGDTVSDADSDCYTATASIHQKPETGRGDYRIQVNGVHAASNGHHSGEQHLFLSFNQSVTYVTSNGELTSGDGTSCIEIKYNYHNNGNDNIGLGDVVVKSEPGLSVSSATLTCNYDCGQH